MQFEYLNPLAGLAMLVAGLFLVTFGYAAYAVPPIAVGLFLILYYRKQLLELIGAYFPSRSA